MNAILEKANKEIFDMASYNPNTRLFKPVKTGRPGNTTMFKPDGNTVNFHSDNTVTGNLVLPGAYHAADKKLREISKDIRIFFKSNMQVPNQRLWDAYNLDINIDIEEVLPTFNPEKQYLSLESAMLYSKKATARKDSEESNEDEQETPPKERGGRTLGNFLDRARKDSRRSKNPRFNPDERKARFEREQEERRRYAKDVAKKRMKDRVMKQDKAKAAKWQEIKDSAETARPPSDKRVDIEVDVVEL